MTKIVLQSKQDESVNFVDNKQTGYLESRFVHRPNTDYFIAYISSQVGCKQACRFCHLTQTGQTQDRCATEEEILEQVDKVFDYYKHTSLDLEKVHINFMARGEPLLNHNLGSFSTYFFIMEKCKKLNLEPVFNLSTIIPKGKTSLAQLAYLVGHYNIPINIYWSVYSFDEDWRHRWMPKAENIENSLKDLRLFYKHANKNTKIVWHTPFIEQENDSPKHVNKLADMINKETSCSQLNIIRYNPFNESSKESTNTQEIYEYLKSKLAETRPSVKIKLIPRVGMDVYASCGTFFSGENK